MIQLPPQIRIMLAYEPVDFRQGIDRLAALCRNHFDQDPFSGTVFLFRNRRATALKLLVYDGQGFWLCLKRFSQGHLAWWPEAATSSTLTRSPARSFSSATAARPPSSCWSTMVKASGCASNASRKGIWRGGRKRQAHRSTRSPPINSLCC